ncbi:hypothetical protein FACS1894177_06460 [Bacteroidia bacterium]|nr:hypothetical protein FACS1894177_06460 [Bacteroidia bacterium]
MAKKILAVRLLVDEKQVRKATSFLDFGDEVIDREDLQRRFFDREPVVIDVVEMFEGQAMPATLAFVGNILLKELEEKENK